MNINRYKRLDPNEWTPPTKEVLEAWRKTEHYKRFIEQSKIEGCQKWLSEMSTTQQPDQLTENNEALLGLDVDSL